MLPWCSSIYYRNVGDRDISLGLVGDCGAISKPSRTAASSHVSKGDGGAAVDRREIHIAEAKAYEKTVAVVQIESSADQPVSGHWRDQRFLTDDTVYIGDGGDLMMITATAVKPSRSRDSMDPGPFGAFGIGASFSMATSSSIRRRRVCSYGDGSFGMTSSGRGNRATLSSCPTWR